MKEKVQEALNKVRPFLQRDTGRFCLIDLRGSYNPQHHA